MMQLISDISLLFLSLILGFLVYPWYIRFLKRYQLGEDIRTDGPQTHLAKKGTPTMGGMPILVIITIVTLIFNFNRNQTIFPLFVLSLAGLFGIIEDLTKISNKMGYEIFKFNPYNNTLIASFKKVLNFVLGTPAYLFAEFWRILGSKTDRGLKSYQKFIIQAGIASFVSYWTYFKLGWDYIWFPFVGDVSIGFGYPILIFFLFFLVLNSVNITDGLDGLVGGLSLISLTCLWVVCFTLQFFSLSSLIASVVGVLIVFLYFNVFPAKIFMGNVGSHVLGALLALIPILIHREILILIIYLVFLVDGISSPIQSIFYKLTKRRIFLMAPVHHHFEMLGWPETQITLRFWIIGIICAFAGLIVALL
jgi:phospho-N-acetylmuramoyl-pentapeptide-transferase